MAPLCICNGVIRSGSTWSFNVCRELYREQAIASQGKFGSAYLDSLPLETFITRQWKSVDGSTVIKAHQLGMNAMAAIHKGQAKAVCTYRDPRDCVASDLAFMNYPLEISLKRVATTLDPLRTYQSTRHILLVRYEDMMSDRLGEIRRIAEHLELRIDRAMLERIDAKTNLQSSQRLCATLKHRPDNELMKIASHLVDPITHLHENHINGGTIGRWKTAFTSDQSAYVSEYFGQWLVQLGYETTQSLRALVTKSAGLNSTPMLLQSRNRLGTFTAGDTLSPRFA